MAINPWEHSQYFDESQQSPTYQPIGDNATVEENFTPQYAEPALKQIIQTYKNNPAAFNQEQKDRIKKHAYYYNVPFYEGDFDIVDALKQLGGGLMEGFTTLNVVDHPDNEYEAVIRNVGHLIGFAPNLLAKPLKLLNLGNQARAVAGIRSIPMLGADWVTKEQRNLLNLY